MEITKHAQERYVQRVMGYTEKIEIASYIAQNEDLIADRITKMCEYGELIYSGKVKEGNFVNVYLHDTWVLLCDRKNEKAITLYKVDLITGNDEFNKLFVNEMKKKIDAINLDLLKAKDNCNNSKLELRDSIEFNTRRIKEYEQLITELKQLNSSYQSIIDHYDIEVHIIEQEYKQAVEDLVSNKIF